MKNRCLLILLVCSIQTNLLYSQRFPWNDFKPRTLKGIIQQSVEAVGASTGDKLFPWGDILPSRVGVIYVGESRAISAARSEFIARWARSLNAAADYASKFETELLFREDGKEYWLPMQKEVIPYFVKEVAKGQNVDLYLIRAGGKRAPDQWDWILLVEEFQKPKPQ